MVLLLVMVTPTEGHAAPWFVKTILVIARAVTAAHSHVVMMVMLVLLLMLMLVVMVIMVVRIMVPTALRA